MPAGAEVFVLDTSALLCLKEDEPGASEVEAILRAHGKKGQVFISFMSIMELAYILEQELGEGAAREGVLQLKQLPLEVVESDEPLGLSAARLKAAHKLSVADAWIAATAERLGATLVHKDPEFQALSKLVGGGAPADEPGGPSDSGTAHGRRSKTKERFERGPGFSGH